MTSDNIIWALEANGYMTNIETVEGVEHVHVVGSRADYLITDLATDERQYFRDATVSVAVLEFAAGEASPLAGRFLADLVKLVAPADRLLKKHARPLVRTTDTTLHAIYQTETPNVGLYLDEAAFVGRRLFEHGLAFPDASEFSTGNLRAACGAVPLDGGVWLNDATPLTVKREALPTWSNAEIAAKLRTLVYKFIAAGELREREMYREPPPKPAFEYGDLSISIDPRDWDVTDPRRNIPGMAEEVRRLRREAGLEQPVQAISYADILAGRR